MLPAHEREMQKDVKILIISANSFEDSELLVPYYRCKEEGMDVDVASLTKGTIKGKRGYEVKVDLALDDVQADAYAALVLPGGKAPEEIRKSDKALEIVKHFMKRNKPVSAICHGPQTLITAGLMKGRRATCYRSVAGEMKKAGAEYEDQEVIVDGNLVTSRKPADIPAFMRETMRLIKRRKNQ